MEDYEKKYKEALSRAATELETCGTDKSLRNMIYAIFPDELKESEDEKIRNRILLSLEKDLMATKNSGCDTQDLEQCIAWLEKQGESYTKKDIDDAYLKGISDAKDELEKQGTSAKLSEEEQNSFSKGVLSNCALSFINYLDAHSYEGKMCVSNGECEDIENAFHNAMWDRLHRYYCKYIEKQDEQKPILDFKASNFYVSKVDGKIHDMTYNSTDKVEPKFKIGDWIVNDYCMGRVIEITSDAYLLDIGQGIPFSCEDKVHLWTIADANEGNILAGKIDGDNYILIFKTVKDGWIETYGHYYNAVDRFCVPSQLFCRSYQGTFAPATKEQRELLFQKMKEAGYEWDAEKKELKKIHVIDDGKSEMDYCFTKMMAGEKVSPDWSNEDERMCQETIDWFEKKCFPYALEEENPARESIKWLKSLKNRVQPQTKKWSEEDETMRENIEGALDCYEGMVDEDWEKEKQWLKSLKDKITWKPSEEQIHAFIQVYVWYSNNFTPSAALTSLYNDLKKL